MKSINHKIAQITQELSVKKERYDEKGHFYYRSIEDIYSAIKPIIKKKKVAIAFEETIEAGFLKCVMTVECLTTSEYRKYSTLIQPVFNGEHDSMITSYTFAKKALLTTAFMIDDGDNEKIKKPSNVELFLDELVKKIHEGSVTEINKAFDVIPSDCKKQVWDRLSTKHQELIKELQSYK